jgi:hypothetical protein
MFQTTNQLVVYVVDIQWTWGFKSLKEGEAHRDHDAKPTCLMCVGHTTSGEDLPKKSEILLRKASETKPSSIRIKLQ